jgi:hypothetical protein
VIFHKPSFLLLPFAIFSLVLAACVPKSAISPTADQNAGATIVASTTQAAATASQIAISKTSSPVIVTPIIPTSTPLTLQVSSTPTILPSPTVTNMHDAAQQIAYIKGGDVYLWTGGIGSIGLTATHDAVDLQISGDGSLIAFKRQDPNDHTSQEIWMVNTSGSPKPTVLVSKADLYTLKATDPNAGLLGYGVLDFTWRPHSHDLAYNTQLLNEGPGFGPNYDLRLVSAETLAKTTLFDTGQGGIFYYSPDGNQIALSNPDSISLVNADGENLRKNVLTFPIVITYSEYYYTPHPIWAIDSTSLRVAIPPEDPLAKPLPPTGLWSIPVDGSTAILLSNVQAMPFAWPDNAFAPGLATVIYIKPVGDQTDNQRELHIASPDGTKDVVYDQGESLEFMSWSPDSKHFIYQVNGGANEGIYTGGFDEKARLLYPDPRSVRDLQWLDDAQFAYLKLNGKLWELRTNSLNGDNSTLIDTLPDSSPTFDVYP